MKTADHTTHPITKAEKQTIQKKYSYLVRLLTPLTPTERKELKDAFDLSYKAHATTRRRCGLPYIMHPLNVSLILVEEIGIKDITTIICALMHDVAEDTGITLEEIGTRFGEKVQTILDALTKIQEPSEKDDYIHIEIINFQKIFSFFAEDLRICPIKIADRLDNMRSLQALHSHKQLKIAHETKAIYAPLAHRLGFGQVKSDLEELYLKYVHPKEYRDVARKIQLRRPERQKTVRDFARPITKLLKEKNIKFRTEMRIKSIYSIYEKMKRKNITFDQIYDLFGLRIIHNHLDEEIAKCWQIYALITHVYPINHRRTRDWISTPRSNGYEALHLQVMSKKGEWVEVQIRSERMHKIDTQGIAAHWKYKGEDQQELSQFINYEELLQEMSALARQESDATQAVQDAQLGLYERDICVFTQVGSRVFLPKGATVLDYAIQIMDERGVYCTRAIVDGTLRHKDYPLKNGQQINAVHINMRQQLQPEWTALTHTPKARKVWKEVFSTFSEKKRKKGKKIIEKELSQGGIPLNYATEHQLKNFFKQETIDHVYYKIGNETIPTEVIQDFIKLKEREEQERKHTHSSSNSPKKHIVITGEDSEDYELALCCSPVPGDRVFGIVPHTKSTIDIHLLECEKAPSLISHYSSSLVEVTWKHTDHVFERCIKFTAIFNPEAKNKIIQLTQEFDVLSFILDKKNLHTKGTIILNVRNVHELLKLMENIKKIEGVLDVSRDTLPTSGYVL